MTVAAHTGAVVKSAAPEQANGDSPMSVGGLCQICEAKEGQYTCDNCGTFVCADHYDEETRLCVQCASTVGGTDSTIDE